MKRHPDVVRRNRKAFLDRQKTKRLAARPTDMITLAEAAKELGLTRQRVHQYVKGGRLAVRRDDSGKRTRLWFVKKDVERFRQERQNEHGQAEKQNSVEYGPSDTDKMQNA
jgi:hypothetical protein